MKEMLSNIIKNIINLILAIICKKSGCCDESCSYKG